MTHFSSITDQIGRLVRWERPIRRIVCLNPSQTETLIHLGLRTYVVGVTKFCVHPHDLKKEKTIVGGTKKVDYEKIRSLHPDIILCNKEENTKEIVETLAREYPVHVTNVTNLDDALAMIFQYGQMFDCTFKAVEICKNIEAERKKLVLFMKQHELKKVAYLIWKNPYMTVGGETFIDHMLGLGGFENAFSNRKRYPEITLNELKELSLDTILLSTEPYPFKENDVKELQEVLGIEVKLVDGEYFSWYGSRLLSAFQYFRSLYGT